MKNGSFEKWDDFFMKHLGPKAPKNVPPEVLKDFSWEVEMKIRQSQAIPVQPRGRKIFSPVWAPIGAVLILLVVLIPHIPGGFRGPHFMSTSEISTEIAAMREVGVWTEEDENQVVGVEGLSDIELLKGVTRH